MDGLWKTVGILLTLANVLSFLLMGIDKQRAERGTWRISERALFLTSACFAALGALIGMRVFHHKTRKTAFRLGIPAMLIAQIALAALIAVKMR